MKRAFVANGTAVSIAQVAAVTGAKRTKDPVMWTATVAQAHAAKPPLLYQPNNENTSRTTVQTTRYMLLE